MSWFSQEQNESGKSKSKKECLCLKTTSLSLKKTGQNLMPPDEGVRSKE